MIIVPKLGPGLTRKSSVNVGLVSEEKRCSNTSDAFFMRRAGWIPLSAVDGIMASPPCFSLFVEFVFYFSFCVTQVGSKIRTLSCTSSITCFYYLTLHNENEDITEILLHNLRLIHVL